jgi:uncharacterized protein Veg
MLVYRENQRDLKKLESIKEKIEHKYLYGNELTSQLSKKKEKNREGMIREVASIPAVRIPSHLRS